ncbi:hypothetical protein, partial [Alienimonas chondri]|uniref:hypothetical protein n=1 Tax=Alienimonas chondri TaxID=2681879 RepID=UPI00148980C0
MLLTAASLLMVFTFTLDKSLAPVKPVDWIALLKMVIRAAAGVGALWLIAAAGPRRRRSAT